MLEMEGQEPANSRILLNDLRSTRPTTWALLFENWESNRCFGTLRISAQSANEL